MVGSGKSYEVSVSTVIFLGGATHHSESIRKVFTTKPLPPTNLTILNSNCQVQTVAGPLL